MNINIDAEKAMAFVTNKCNIGNCEECPYNVGADERQKVYACGQLFCWIDLFAKKMTDWISVEKELPEEDGEYLVSAKPILGNNSPSYVDVAYFTTDLYGIDEHDFYNKKGVPGFYKYGSEWGIYKVNPIAWRPLPEPYKEEEK